MDIFKKVKILKKSEYRTWYYFVKISEKNYEKIVTMRIEDIIFLILFTFFIIIV